jgi:group I intron endonuclease
MIGIYKITNPQGKIYIGCSTNLEKRKFKYSYIDCKSQPKLYESLNTFGWENHVWEIIKECFEEQLFDLEKYYINEYNSYNEGLNSNPGGYGITHHTEKTKSQISKTKKGWIPSEERGKKISNKIKGRKYTNEHKSKISKQTKGKSKGLKGRTSPNKGNSYSQEVKDIMNIKKKGVNLSVEHKNKISQSFKGKKPIEQYDLEGNFIKLWDNKTTAQNWLGKGDINSCLRGRQKTAGGFIWKRVS